MSKGEVSLVQEMEILSPKQNKDPPSMEIEYTFSPSVSSRDIDTGWAWVVLASCFFNMMLLGAAISVVGIFHIFLLDAFDESDSITAWVGSIYVGLQNLMGPFASWVSDRWSCRTCAMFGGLISAASLATRSQATSLWMSFLTYGILAGAGISMILTPTFSSIGYSFNKYRSIASSICVMGYPLGLMSGPVLVKTFEDYFGWRGAVLLFSGLILNSCVLSALQRPSSKEIQQQKNFRTRTCSVPSFRHAVQCLYIKPDSLLRNSEFMFLATSFLLSNFAMGILYLHFPKYVLEQDGTIADIHSIYALIGVGNMASKLLTGIASGNSRSDVHLNKLCLLFGAYSIAGTSLIILPLVSNVQAGRMVCFFLISFYYGVESPLYVPLTLDILPLKYLNLAIGCELFSSGIGYTLGPPFAAWVRQISKDYKYSFYLAGLSFLLAAIFCLFSVLGRSSNKANIGDNKDQAIKTEEEVGV